MKFTTWIINDMRIVSMLQLAGYIAREINQHQDRENYYYETNAPINPDCLGIGLKLTEGTIYVEGRELTLHFVELTLKENIANKLQERTPYERMLIAMEREVQRNRKEELSRKGMPISKETQYIITDERVIKILKQNNIYFDHKANSYWYNVDLRLDERKKKYLQDGKALIRRGSCLDLVEDGSKI